MKTLPSIAAPLLLAGCVGNPASPPEAEADALSGGPALPYSAGYIVHDDGPIAPYGPAVLVAPDVAVTARHYLLDENSNFMSVMFDSPEGPKSARVRGEIHQQGQDAAFAAVLLEAPIEEVAPAVLGSGASGCELIASGYSYVLEGEAVERVALDGCVAAETETGFLLDLADHAPGCHYGDGAAVYDADSRELVGLAAGVYSEPEDGPCVSGLEVVDIDALEPFLSTLRDE